MSQIAKLRESPHPYARLQVQPVLSRLEQRVLLLTGGRDLLLASAEEGPRLKRLLPRSRLKVGHCCADAAVWQAYPAATVAVSRASARLQDEHI